jgi:site-specific DNA recombinase
MKSAAIYARVSSDQQKEENTIASQTAALVEFARQQGFDAPDEWVFEDEGFSGASLVRPGLERLRDLAAEGHIQAILIHSPDRLSRKYAYQVLLTEEFARHGVETIFVKAPHAGTPEDELMLQFQGMIAEYERAQILERSRRGKRHRAKAGEISVLSGAPYGYRYVRKSADAPARYEIVATEAEVVRLVYEKYTAGGLSIGAIARLLNEMGPPTRRRITRWERSVVWAMLRNPAYKGTACYGKSQVAPRQRVTKPLRLSGRARRGDTGNHERPREDWIEVPVPAIVAEEAFALAAEKLLDNKRFAPRRTIEPSIVQGLVSCRKCGYALSRTSTRSSARKIHYYRCLGSVGWRHLGGAVCDSRPIRQDLLDQVVWQEVIRLIEDPTLIGTELDRRLEAARAAEPTKRRQENLERELARLTKSIDRLVTAYQEELLSLEELRHRMPELRARDQAIRAELQAILDQAADRLSFLRLAETLSAFLARLRETVETLDIVGRQRIVRLVVKEVLVDDDAIVIRHSIPVRHSPPGDGEPPVPAGRSSPGDRSYLLRSGSDHRPLTRPRLAHADDPVLQDPRLQPFLDQAEDALVADPVFQEPDQPILADRVEEAPDVGVQDEVHLLRRDPNHQGVQRIVLAALGAEPVAEPEEVFLVDGVQHREHRLLDDLVLQGGNRQRALFAVGLGYHHPPRRLRPIRPAMDPVVQIDEPGLKISLPGRPCHPIHAGGRVTPKREERFPKQADIHMVQERGERLRLPLPCGLPYAVQRL